MKQILENSTSLSERNGNRLAFEPVLCAVCSDPEYQMSDIEGYTHLCVACACGQMQEELEQQWAKELSIYNKRAGTNYDFDSFCLDCWGDVPEIDKSKLKGLSELKEIYETERCHYREYTAPPDPQLELDFGGLPF